MKRPERKLWLDDERDPKDPKVQELFGSDGTETWVKTANAAIELLMAGGWTHVSLDHDLGPVSSGTGQDVADFIERNAFHGTLAPMYCRVHSMNCVGAKTMRQAIAVAERCWSEP